MSRVAKKGIVLPPKVEVAITNGVLHVKGPKGELSKPVPAEFSIVTEDNTLFPKMTTVENVALLGTYTSFVNSMVIGVTTGFTKKLQLEGVGYRSEVKGKEMVFALGFSHPVKLQIPEGLTVTSEKNVVTITGIDKDVVGSFAAEIRSQKKPEPYKGKGFRYSGEVIRMKQGKKSV
ncbi:MAG TPA: 50S ribosomal protein L6 [Candidatus Paceibacterota bacterium]|nr:50S ribosomal protein L6 [Candidatus Paceibacterota bacterium]